MAAESIRPVSPDRGIYVLGDSTAREYDDLEFLKGGKIAYQWQDLNPGENEYNWQPIDEELKNYARKGQKATIQVYGSDKPEWLFDKVAWLPVTKMVQVNDKAILQYWDPVFIDYHKAFIKALAEHLKSSPLKDSILGVRQNFNAIGSEYLKVDTPEFKEWHAAGNGRKHEVDWTTEIMRDYQKQILAAYIDNFRPASGTKINLFIRNNIMDEDVLTDSQKAMLAAGEIGLFHTSSEYQPRVFGKGSIDQNKYLAFIEYCRSGLTVALSEPWRPARRWTSEKRPTKNDEKVSRVQYVYWRSLLDLHCGVTFIAHKPDDFALLRDPEMTAEEKSALLEAFEMCGIYAGTLPYPENAPGAWVALREADKFLEPENTVPLKWNPLLGGDYEFLMNRLPSSVDKPLKFQGPFTSGYGLFTRSIDEQGMMIFKMDSVFAKSLEGERAVLRVVYLDEGTNPFIVAWDQGGKIKQRAIDKQDSGEWKNLTIDLDQPQFTGGLQGGDIVLTTTGGTSVFHLVEVKRRPAAGG